VRLNSGGTRLLSAETIVINVGDRPSRPAIPGLETVPFLDSTSIMDLGRAPAHLLVLGGGYVGLEFAQMFRRFGSRVTMIHPNSHLLDREDADVAEQVQQILHEDGITLLLNTAAERIARAKGGVRLSVRAAKTGRARALAGSHLLVATGRVPNTDRLNLAAAGVEADARGFIVVNERLETNVPGIYALGDVKGGPAFTHISYDDFRIVRANLLHGGSESTRGRLVPYTVFIDPQLGRIGLTEKEARDEGRNVRIAMLPMSRCCAGGSASSKSSERSTAAFRHAHPAISLFEEVGVEVNKANPYMTLCELEFSRHAYEAAMRHARSALEVADRTGEVSNIGEARLWFARIAEATGDPATADAQFADAITILESQGPGERVSRAHALYAEVLEARGDLAGAVEAVGAAVRRLREERGLSRRALSGDMPRAILAAVCRSM